MTAPTPSDRWNALISAKPDPDALAAIRYLAEHFQHLLSPEQRAGLRGWLGRVGV